MRACSCSPHGGFYLAGGAVSDRLDEGGHRVVRHIGRLAGHRPDHGAGGRVGDGAGDRERGQVVAAAGVPNAR